MAMTARPVSAFSRSFALHLRGVMTDRNIQQTAVAELMGRSKGYVSEHTSGTRAVDSDLLDAVAEVAGVDTRELLAEIARRMLATVANRPPDLDVSPDVAAGLDAYQRGLSADVDHEAVDPQTGTGRSDTA